MQIPAHRATGSDTHQLSGSQQRATRALQAIMEGVVLFIACLAPWAFGGVDQGFEELFYAAVAALLVLWSIRTMIESRIAWQRCPVAVCLALIVLAGAAQLLPLPEPLLDRLSPATSELYQQLLPAEREVLPTGETVERPGDPTGSTISLYPAATRRLLLPAVAALLLFLVVRNNVSPLDGMRRLSIAMLVNSACLSLFAFIQFFTSQRGMLYWTYTSDGSVFGPFVNRNHFAFHTNIAIGLGIGLLLYRGWRPARESQPGGAGSGRSGRGASSGRRPRPLANLLHDPASIWIAVALGLMLAATVFCLSRGGFVALLGSAAVCGMLMQSRKGSGWRAGAGILAIALGAGILGWFGYEEIQARLSTLWSGEAFQGDRLKLLVRGWSCFQQFPLWGTGYGTFEFVEPIYFHDPTDVGWVYEHAHNEYLHAALEGGVIRLLLCVAAIALVYRLGWRALQAHEATPSRGLILGGLFAFTTVVIHSFVEFGLHIPAIAILLTVLAAYLSGLGAAAPTFIAGAPERALRRELSLPLPSGTPLVVAAAAILLGAVMVQAEYDVDSIGELRRAARRLPLDGPDARHHLEELNSLARLRTPDAELEMALGEAYLDYDRLVLKSDAAGRPTASRLKALWHFVRARDLCPILPVAHVRLAANRQHLRRGDPPEVYLERAKRVAPANAQLWFLCGTYELSARQEARAWANWRRSLELSEEFLPDILAAAREHLGPQQMLQRLLPERPGVLLAAARFEAEAAQSVLPGAAERREAFLRRALALLQAQTRLVAAEWAQVAEIQTALGRPVEAIAAYERAVADQPEHVPWRYALAQILHEQGRLDEAREQLRIVLAYEPQHSRALALLKDVARRRAEGAVDLLTQ